MYGKLITAAVLLFALSAKGSQGLVEAPGINGVVLDAVTHQPLADVQVTTSSFPPLGALTDGNGRFVIENLTPGRIGLTFSKSGYSNYSALYNFISGQRIKDITVSMSPTGVISGRLTKNNGAPAIGVWVAVMRYRNSVGGPELTIPAMERTNDRGEFRIFNLSPGHYIVGFGGGNPGTEEGTSRTPILTLYPGVSELAKAETVDVKGGEETRLKSVGLADIQGMLRIRIVNGPGEPAKEISVSTGYATPVLGINGLSSLSLPRVHLDAAGIVTKTIKPAQVGIQVVAVGWTDVDGTFNSILTPIAFTGRTIDVDILVAKPRRLHIHSVLLQQSGNEVSLANTPIFLCPSTLSSCSAPELGLSVRVERTWMIGSGLNLGSDGSLSLTANPGQYDLYNLRVPDGYYISSARQGDHNVLTDGVTISEKSPSVEIEIHPNAATLQGRAIDSGGRPVQNALVAVLPEPPMDKSKLQTLRRTIRTDQNGQFELRNLIPGDYRIYAWSSVSDDSYLDPRFVADSRDRSALVHIEGPTSLDLTIPN